MVSTRKSRMMNKRLSKLSEGSSEKDESNANKNKTKKRKLSDMLGYRWSEKDIELFYDAYRKYGKDWKKVASTIPNRTVDMVEALYNMNRAYLSLPEGTATVTGLIGMMTYHYNILKRNLSEMLGHRWSKEEIERFYVAYRKCGKDWRKVASTIRNRTVDMVEALYNMNKAYLSLPEGTATATGLIGMMTYHYNILGGSDGDNDGNGGLQTSQKMQKSVQGRLHPSISKGSEASCPDLSHYQSATTSYGCLSLLKRKRSGGSRPRAVGKRTPRFPVSYTHDREGRSKSGSPFKQVKFEGEADDDEGAHVAAMALAEASKRVGSPQVSQTPGITEHARSSPVHSIERKFAAVQKDDDGDEGSLRSIEAETGDFMLDNEFRHESKSIDMIGTQQKVKKSKGKKPKAIVTENNPVDDDVREACSGTEEGFNIRGIKTGVDTDISDRKAMRSSQGPRKRNRQLFSGDETTALDALQTLADLSLNILLPGSAIESESSVQAKEDKINSDVEKPVMAETSPKSKKDKSKVLHRKTGKVTGARKSSKQQKALSPDMKIPPDTKPEGDQPVRKIRKKKQKPAINKISKDEVFEDICSAGSPKKEIIIEESMKAFGKSKGVNPVLNQKQMKFVKTLEQVSSDHATSRTLVTEPESSAQISIAGHASLPGKSQSRRKIELEKTLSSGKLKAYVLTGEENMGKYAYAAGGRGDLKDKVFHGLSSPLLRRWCIFEWFYSAIDYPWFAKREFVEYLNHVGLGHVPRLTRVEWGVIRSSLGKPRRLSKQFLQEEREKLEQYRESVRAHYAELRAGVREGLPTDLARPLSVGQRVIACHPKTREIHDGSILTVDRNRCRVQFDRPELGVEFVMDVDCMPLNPTENMPEAFRKNLVVDKISEAFYGTKPYIQPQDWRLDDSLKFSSGETVEHADDSSHVNSSSYQMNTLMKQAKGDTVDAIMEAKAAANEVAAAAQQAILTQSCTLAQMQAREADIKALAELTRALDKKEALLIELRNMNEEVSKKQKEGDSIKEFEHFRKQYAMVLLQLRDANDQVASALLYLRQRNTYHGNATPPWMKSIDNPGAPTGGQGSLTQCGFSNQDSGPHVRHIIEGSRQKARAMVDVAVKALYLLKEGEDAFMRIGEALDSIKGSHSGDLALSSVKSAPLNETVPSACKDQASACQPEPTSTQASSLNANTTSCVDCQLPSELISSCIATLLMIQTCTERHDPPAEVAHILDSAVSSLQPCCPQNLPIYREIETCMGIIKNQMLAKIPTPTSISPSDVTVM